MEFIRQHQLDIMLVLSGICGVMTLFVYMTNTMSARRKTILILLELSAMLVLVADRRAYMYRGDTTTLGWYMVRISNFLVFFLLLVIIFSFNLYLIDLLTNEGKLKRVPLLLKIAHILALFGMVMVIISQFTGFYYTFDEMNRYQRGPGFFICYLIPMTILMLQIVVIARHYGSLSPSMRVSLILFTVISVVAGICQAFMYGISLNNMAVVALAALLYVFALQDMSREVERARKLEIDYYREEQKRDHALFEQTVEALASAIDAKDPYTNGHSRRVAEYSQKIARAVGKSEEECEKIYFTGLLHDVGKIGIPSSIINKKGRLTNEEYEQIKQHPVKGGQILSTIKQSPWLSIGARYHHERYGGRGYPEGLKGEDIPEIARIVAVADAYDAMTSNRSYRNSIPQHIVREELVKGMGTQFDPEFAKAMLHLLDVDTEYKMQEKVSGANLAPMTSLRCDTLYNDCSEGIAITPKTAQISFCCQPDSGLPAEDCLPTLILFDALDGMVHPGEEKNENLLYSEYGLLRLDGRLTELGIRKAEIRVLDQETSIVPDILGQPERELRYSVEAVKYLDQVRIRISDSQKVTQFILALPDPSRYFYISIGGEHCYVHNINVETSETEAGPDTIPRIAEEISYIKDCPEGDIPNIQINGWRSDATMGIPIDDGLTLSFHTKSLPTARLVWHCPFIDVFSSDDGSVNGANYREYILLRLDGENWESDEHAENQVRINQQDDFGGWNFWKEKNKQGLDCTVTIRRKKNRITMKSENLGISIHSETTILDDTQNIYVALTGDQCAITNIRVSRGK